MHTYLSEPKTRDQIDFVVGQVYIIINHEFESINNVELTVGAGHCLSGYDLNIQKVCTAGNRHTYAKFVLVKDVIDQDVLDHKKPYTVIKESHDVTV